MSECAWSLHFNRVYVSLSWIFFLHVYLPLWFVYSLKIRIHKWSHLLHWSGLQRTNAQILVQYFCIYLSNTHSFYMSHEWKHVLFLILFLSLFLSVNPTLLIYHSHSFSLTLSVSVSFSISSRVDSKIGFKAIIMWKYFLFLHVSFKTLHPWTQIFLLFLKIAVVNVPVLNSPIPNVSQTCIHVITEWIWKLFAIN